MIDVTLTFHAIKICWLILMLRHYARYFDADTDANRRRLILMLMFSLSMDIDYFRFS